MPSLTRDRPFALIVGGGPAGSEAALLLCRAGKSVVLVEQDRPGGRALWHSLIPSKVWLSFAETLDGLARWEGMFSPPAPGAEIARMVLDRLRTIRSALDERLKTHLQKAGVRLVQGQARFLDARTLQVQQKDRPALSFQPEYVLLASGSVPLFPEGIRPDGLRILAPRFMGALERLPASMVVLGGGVTGCEFIYLFNRLGTRVTAVTDVEQLLPRMSHPIAQRLEAQLSTRGVRFIKGVAATQVVNTGRAVQVSLAGGQTLEAEAAFVALGRRPDLAALNLPAAGLQTNDHGGITVDRQCRTSLEHVFAAGDVTGAPMLANRARLQARIAALNMLTPGSATFRPEQVVEAVYTHPTVARVGHTAEEIEQRFPGDASWLELPFHLSDRALLDGAEDGLLRIGYQVSTGRVLAAEVIGEQAAELLTPVALLIRQEGKLEDLAALAPANPTYSELFLFAGKPRGD